MRAAHAFLAVLALSVCSMLHAEDHTEWLKQAEGKVKALFNGDGMAKSLLSHSHPTGDESSIVIVNTANDGSIVEAVITFTWKGGITGAQYETAVRWRFDVAKHLSAEIIKDNAIIGVSDSKKKEMNTWFRDTLFPEIVK